MQRIGRAAKTQVSSIPASNRYQLPKRESNYYETKQNKKYGLKWQSCGAKISSWEVQGSACYFADIRGADFFSLPGTAIPAQNSRRKRQHLGALPI